MKALILAAGLGTRLKPHTDHRPKALFTVNGRCLLDRIIEALAQSGCREILINTHHLHEQIEAHVAAGDYAIPVRTRHEPQILGTGGAIQNAADFLGDGPFWVVNSDILTDIDLSDVYRFHLGHGAPATLVLVDEPAVNTVCVDGDGNISGFIEPAGCAAAGPDRRLTFTGIQVVNPECLAFIPPGRFSSSIDAYGRMIDAGRQIKAYLAADCRWQDLGTPDRYRTAVIRAMAADAFRKMGIDPPPPENIGLQPIQGDGSDRRWHRLHAAGHTLVMVEHGIRGTVKTTEADAFIRIGRHLFDRGVPVPEIVAHDAFSGVVVLEDLGDMHLQTFVRNARSGQAVMDRYRQVIDALVHMSLKGYSGFDPSWTYQTQRYDEPFILHYECRYFVDAFVNGCRGMGVEFESLAPEFTQIARHAVGFGLTGFMHRDFQSRNIMIRDERIYFIDFQGGRLGPLQYDLASLLIDPYTTLSGAVQRDLLDYATARISSLLPSADRRRFVEGYRFCALARNLQALGAYGYLSRQKGKAGFEAYIPAAVRSLKEQLNRFDDGRFPLLKEVAQRL